MKYEDQHPEFKKEWFILDENGKSQPLGNWKILGIDWALDGTQAMIRQDFADFGLRIVVNNGKQPKEITLQPNL